MDPLPCKGKDQSSVLNPNTQTNLPEDLRKYKELNSAIRLGQKKIIEILLRRKVSVNRPAYFLSTLETPLHSSVHLGDLEITKKLLCHGASVNDEYLGDTPLTLATKFQKNEIVDLLLLAQGLENYKNDNGVTHFHVACMRDKLDVAKSLLKSEPNINTKVNADSDFWPGFTPLHFAVKYQCIQTVEFLLNLGADITIKNSMSVTPLHLAYECQNVQIIDMILSVHPEVLTNPVNSKGLSHFHIACTRNKPKVIEYFIKLGVDLEHPISPQEEGSESGSSDIGSAEEMKTGLDLAVENQCVDVVRLLLQFGFCTTLDRQTRSNLVRNAYRTGNVKIVDLLSSTSYELKQELTKRKKLPALVSLEYKDSEIIRKLRIQTHCALNSRITPNGCTLLHAAVRHGNREVTKFLLTQGADYTVKDIHGSTSIHLAFERNQGDLIDLMFRSRKNYDSNPSDKNGVTHFHIACARNNSNMIEYFLKHGANVNGIVNLDATFWPGFTPLHFAAKLVNSENHRAAQTLLEHGACYSAIDASGLSAFDYALLEASSNPFDIDESTSAFEFMKLILTSHCRLQNHLFNDRGFTLLHLASATFESSNLSIEEFKEVVQAHPEDINKSIHKIDSDWDGYTPLHFAMREMIDGDARNNAEILIAMGADILMQTSNGDTPLHLLNPDYSWAQFTIDFQDSRLLKLNHIGSTGKSIFHTACVKGNLELMKYFLQHGVDPNYPSLSSELGCEDDAPLHLVIYNHSDSSVRAVKLLLEFGANPGIRNHHKDTPLHINDFIPPLTGFVDSLVSHGADINARNILGETPLLHVCNFSGCHLSYFGDMILEFLMQGADINLADRLGNTPLTIETWYKRNRGDISTIHALLTHVIKLKSADLYISRTNKEAYFSLKENFQEEYIFDEDEATMQCLKELELLKTVHTDKRTNLYDILHQNVNKLALTSQNKIFQEIVNSNGFTEKYPIYGPFLRFHLRRGKKRLSLLKDSRGSLSLLLRNALPRLCVEEILQYLDDEDLENIIIKIDR